MKEGIRIEGIRYHVGQVVCCPMSDTVRVVIGIEGGLPVTCDLSPEEVSKLRSGQKRIKVLTQKKDQTGSRQK